MAPRRPGCLDGALQEPLPAVGIAGAQGGRQTPFALERFLLLHQEGHGPGNWRQRKPFVDSSRDFIRRLKIARAGYRHRWEFVEKFPFVWKRKGNRTA